MADVAQVSLVEPEQIDFDHYQDGGGSGIPLPAEGQYFGKAPIFPADPKSPVYGATQAGFLKIAVDPIEVVNSTTGNGYKVRFASLSAKKYSNREGNQIMDFLRACGLDVKPKTNADYIAAVRLASGRTFKFGLTWEAYNKDTQETTKGMENFPDDPQNPGKKKLPYLVEANGQPQTLSDGKKVYANGRVRYFVSAVAAK